MKRIGAGWIILLLGFSAACGAEPTPLLHGHAHNDYLHPRPLLDALDQGFCSVEADIFLVDGKLQERPAGTTGLRVPPGKQNFEFRYTALSLTDAGKVQFR